jgi:hypothetical protein
MIARRVGTLNFPNQSCVFDATRRAVRFWGHRPHLMRLEPKTTAATNEDRRIAELASGQRAE